MESLLQNGETRSGSYLVTGYRGMGKTSLVRKIIRKVKNTDKRVIPIELSLAQDELKDIDILRHLAVRLDSEFRRFFMGTLFGLSWTLRYLLALLVSLQLPLVAKLIPEESSAIKYVVLFIGTLAILFLLPFAVNRVHKLAGNDANTRATLRSIGLLALLSIFSLPLQTLWPVIIDYFEIFTRENCWFWFCEHEVWLATFLLPLLAVWSLLMIGSKLVSYIFRVCDVVGPIGILNRFERLKESIESQITIEQGKEVGLQKVYMQALFKRRKEKLFPIAQAKTVEYELIDILQDLGRMGVDGDSIWQWFFPAPRFFIVFDELDKIEPNYNHAFANKEVEDVAKDRSGNVFTTDSQRRRQEALALLLSNLKHFLNVAQAKFIFIAGREMFDASLADISDRESFFGSVFHDVFYVESFYKESSQGSTFGITQLSQEFVVRTLLNVYQKNAYQQRFSDENQRGLFFSEANVGNAEGSKWEDRTKREAKMLANCEVPDLRHYDFWLKHEWQAGQLYKGFDDHPEDWKRMEREKIITTLNNLIIYLSYRSNGTPKRLNALFEDFLTSIDPEAPGGDGRSDKVFVQLPSGSRQDSKSRIFLKISYQRQYILGLTAYLIRPYLITHSHFIRTYGDKLLVSTTYMMDHLFKFHKHSFSWRNLELIPEIISFNKAPELRKFIGDLIQFLSHSQIRETNYSLFQFKFFKKVSNEIAHVSQISEKESAAFNFTLDESLLIKKHYHRKLNELHKSFPPESKGPPSEHINSIAFVNGILGDLHFSDREYDDAIIHYANTIQALRSQKMSEISYFSFYLYLREKLKLTLTVEKINDFSTALVHISDLQNDLLDFFTSHNHSLSSDKAILSKRQRSRNIEDTARKHKVKTEKDKTMIQNLPLIVLPFLKELVLIEKLAPMGITKHDIERNRAKFSNFLIECVGKTYKTAFLEVIYFHNLATVLYYKNGMVEDVSSLGSEVYGKYLKVEFDHNEISSTDQLFRGKVSNDFKASLNAYYYYCESLRLLTSKQPARTKPSTYKGFTKASLLPEEVKSSFLAVIELLDLGYGAIEMQTIAKAEWEQFGSCLSKLGDVVVTMLHPGGEGMGLNNKFLNGVFVLLSTRQPGDDHSGFATEGLNDVFGGYGSKKYWPSINAVILCYFLSGMCYRRAGRHSSYSQQLLKIQYLLKDFIVVEDFAHEKLIKSHPSADLGRSWEGRDAIMQSLIDYHDNPMLSKILETAHWTHQTTGRPQVLKMERILGYDELETSSESLRTLYNSLSMTPDMKEGTIIFSELMFKAQRAEGFQKHLGKDFHIGINPVNAYSSVSNKFIRVLELSFKARLNYQYLKEAGVKQFLDFLNTWRMLQSQVKSQVTRISTDQKSNIDYPCKGLLGRLAELNKSIHKTPLIEPGNERINFARLLVRLRCVLKAINFPHEGESLKELLIHFIALELIVRENTANLKSVLRQALKEFKQSLDSDIESYGKDEEAALANMLDQLVVFKDRDPQSSVRTEFQRDIDTALFRVIANEVQEVFETGLIKQDSYKKLKQAFVNRLSRLINDTRRYYIVSCLNNCNYTFRKDYLRVFPLKNAPSMMALGKFLIADSIFCLSEVLRNLNVYGISYMYNHSFQGYMRMYLADWGRYHHYFKQAFRKNIYEDQQEGLDSTDVEPHNPQKWWELEIGGDPLGVEELIGVNTLHHLDPKYNQEQAITHFQQALEMHNEGKAYRSQLNHMSFLEDDFNDNFYHFCAALERYKINAGLIRHNIEKLKEDVRHSRFYQYSSYVNTATTPEPDELSEV